MMTLPTLLLRIHGESDDARFEAWKILYQSQEPHYIAELEKILLGENPVLCVLLARFLANMPDKRATEYLAQLLSSANSAVVEAARKAFEKNHYQKKANELLPVLNAKTDPARFFAIEKLAQGAITDALPYLLERLNQAQVDEQIKILTALKHLPDKRLLTDLKIYLNHENADLRFRTVLIFASILETRVQAAHGLILSVLQDKDARVRQAAVWAIARNVTPLDAARFHALIKNDKDPLVRQEAVKGLAKFFSHQTIRILVETLVLDPSRMVALRAEASLLKSPSRHYVRGLKKLLKHDNLNVARKALYLLAASDNQSAFFFRDLTKGLAKAQKDSERLTYIEALGIFGSPKAMPILKPFLKSTPILAYGALAAILQINEHALNFPYSDYLNSPDLSDILKQMVLKHYLKNENAEETLPDEFFIAQLENKNLNLRYLAALALTKKPGRPAIEPLLKMVLKENNGLLKKFLSQSLSRILAKDPLLLNSIVLIFQFNAEAIQKLLNLAHDLSLSADDSMSLLKSFLSPEHDFLITEHLPLFSRFAAKQLIAGRIRLDELLLLVRPHQDASQICAAIADELSHFPLAQISSHAKVFLDELLVHKRLDAATIVKLMTFGHGPDMAKALVTVLTHTELQSCHAFASKGLRRVLEANL